MIGLQMAKRNVLMLFAPVSAIPESLAWPGPACLSLACSTESLRFAVHTTPAAAYRGPELAWGA